MISVSDLNAHLGNMDVHLLDQLLKGRFESGVKILEIGSGEGRNLVYFLQNSFEVFALDKAPNSIKMLQMHARSLRSVCPPGNFIVGDFQSLPYPNSSMEWVISCASLHFAESKDSFCSSLTEMVRVLKPAGFLFLKMNGSLKGLPAPDAGQERFVFTNDHLNMLIRDLSLDLVEPPRVEWLEGHPSNVILLLTKK